MVNSNNPHLGSTLDDWLAEEGILGHCEAVAMKRVIAVQLQQLMQEQQLTKIALAQRMHTNLATLNKLLDPHNTAVTLETLVRGVTAIGGVQLDISLSRQPA